MTAGWCRPAPTSGPFARDFEAYYAAGATRNAGGDPYARDIWRVERTIPGVDATHDEMLPYVGPAAALPLWSLLARLPFDAARAVWEGVLLAAAGALVVASLAIAGSASRARAFVALALAGASGPVISAFTLGQAALLGAAATACAFAALERRRLAAVAAALLAAIQPNLALPLAARAFDRRALATLATAAAIFALLTFGAGGGAIGTYLDHLRAHGAAERYIAIQYTLPAIAVAFGAPHAAADALGVAGTLAALALAGTIAYRRRAQPALVACVAVAVLPFAVPFFHEHDFALELLPIVVLARRGSAPLRALAGAAAVMMLVDWFGLAQRPTAAIQIAALACAVAAAYALLAARDDDVRADARLVMLVPFATAFAIALAALPLAHAFPAPTWPDALGPYRAPPGADISTIWADESRLAGLGSIVPAWGLLRAIPLAGCALAAWASVRLAGYATNTAPSRTSSGTGVNDSPLHGPAVQ